MPSSVGPRSSFVAALAAREHRHGRALLLAVGALIVFSTSPVFGHHIAGRADAVLAGRDHLWSLCLIALHLMLAPVHRFFHLLLVGGLLYALWDRLRAWRSVRRALGAPHTRGGHGGGHAPGT